ncbi:class I lanthipeptide [Hymenobacter aquaticus]|uniref:class I lanthipeptide n=1 Tax=Hymenobacter aquaticus TaxID=1867101 RepID=UPI001AEBE6DE
MKKEKIARKLSLNKQTLSELDAKAMNSIKGGLVLKTETGQCSDGCVTRTCTVA